MDTGANRRILLNAALNCLEKQEKFHLLQAGGVRFWPTLRLPLVLYLESVLLGRTSLEPIEARLAGRLFLSAIEIALLPLALLRFWWHRPRRWLVDNSNFLNLEGSRAVNRCLTRAIETTGDLGVVEISVGVQKRMFSLMKRRGLILRTQRNFFLQLLIERRLWKTRKYRAVAERLAAGLQRARRRAAQD